MDRRNFVKSTLASSAAAYYSIIATSGSTLLANNAQTSIRAVSLDGAEIELSAAMVKELGNSMTGPVILSNHSEYNTARKIWNGMHDKKPALIARCLSSG